MILEALEQAMDRRDEVFDVIEIRRTRTKQSVAYARTKGELLLLVQNSTYADALVAGRTAAEAIPDVFEAVMAIVRPVVECNRKQIDNGRTYLREIVFGDPEEPHHRDALTLTVQTEEAIADVLRRDPRIEAKEAGTLAHLVSAIMFLSMAATINIPRSVDEILSEISEHVSVLLQTRGRV